MSSPSSPCRTPLTLAPSHPLLRPPQILDKSGVVTFTQQSLLTAPIANLSSRHLASAFAETYVDSLTSALSSTKRLGKELATVSLATAFPSSGLGMSFAEVAKVIKARDSLGEERSVFYVSLGGFDHHSSLKESLDAKFVQIDAALAAFTAEMKSQGIWDSVALLEASDFGRTLGTNGQGTDHAWGGHYFLLGGKVRGGQILGQFPPSLLETSDTNIGRNGRMLPTTPWEGIWSGLAEWFGVEASRLPNVLPNAPNFPASQVYDKSQLFRD